MDYSTNFPTVRPWSVAPEDPTFIAAPGGNVAICDDDANGAANAALIVAAVNNIEGLLETARAVVESIGEHGESAPDWQFVQELRAAIESTERSLGE